MFEDGDTVRHRRLGMGRIVVSEALPVNEGEIWFMSDYPYYDAPQRVSIELLRPERLASSRMRKASCWARTIQSMKGNTVMARDDMRLILAVIEAADARPDYEYKSDHIRCVYVDTEYDPITDEITAHKPSCLIGCGLAAVGIPLDELIEHGNGLSASEMIERLGALEVSRDVKWLMADVQNAQDRNTPWGEAVKPLKAYLEDVKEESYT